MWVLDLDLDFFLSDCCPMAEYGERPIHCAAPWNAADVQRFLEENCGLSKEHPIPGRIFSTHDLALDFWREQIQLGNLTAPFSVTHVDAHSDLGIAPPRSAYVEHSVLCQPPAQRPNLERYRREQQLTEANYLLFAMGFRWLSALENVRNPRSHRDMPEELQTDAAHLRLRQPFPQIFAAKYGAESSVCYREYPDWTAYHHAQPFDMLSLAISPRYTPIEADSLVGVIRQYIQDLRFAAGILPARRESTEYRHQ